MRFITTSLAVMLMASHGAVADFLIFCGAENQAPDPASNSLVLFFNNPPDCDDAVNHAIQWNIDPFNDASNGGIACDGCDGGKAPQDWDVTRFEVFDDNGNTFDNGGDQPHFTLYKDTANGGWGMYDVNMNQIGTCDRPDPVQILTCPDVFSADNAAGIIHCSTALSIKGSN
ncbi:hypothetical protein NM208_g7100 [Fusarium decemcellulare]|uniref:Uncharacterized protein n=1 Tax=Fusarium decemcellulare TaxID=57161 RepID=A0ACC1SAH9_9HYPO|nr:hypothetical protein NM208_g7100 [Fusarium decemcellulare]